MSDSERYFIELAAAFVRGRSPEAPALEAEPLVAWGKAQGLRVHKFKRNSELPRVRRVLGMLQGLGPANLLDVGSGRGTFLWPLVDAMPWLPVTSVELSPRRVRDIGAVRDGGVERLSVVEASVESLPLPDKEFDVITALEVLEHVEDPQRAAAELVRVGRRHVLVSVPSKPDDNPEHIRLFTADSLTRLFLDAGAERVSLDGVLNHFIALVSLPRSR